MISLIGPHQANAIERRLIDHPAIGHEKIQAHRIICGDSTTLQGQERDIVEPDRRDDAMRGEKRSLGRLAPLLS